MSATNIATPVAPPLLFNGQRLDQAEFHARYEETAPDFHAELINGVVFVREPHTPQHGSASVRVIVWLSYYQEETPGVEALPHVTTIFGPRTETEPDCLLYLLPEYGGPTHPDPQILRGVPELLVEVAHSTRYLDLGPKLEDYERAGVLEYVVLAIEPDEVLWHELRDGRLVPVETGPDGLFRSRVFPGLWLEPQSLLARDSRRIREVLDQGLASPEHTAFVAELARRRRARSDAHGGASPS